MVSMSSTLVETVSINYEDFNESFLTCGTCLCVYDGQEHTPKLLPCSHTVCLHCLGRIAASQTRDVGSFRCPICRELFHVPRGGVAAIPPSFLVNQLLDLMARQRREVVPKCSEHSSQELLFCETCDTVFCTICTGGHVSSTASSSEHTVIPFSIAIKRMSEILLYKANECAGKLTLAHDALQAEVVRLQGAAEKCRDQVDVTFQEMSSLLEQRRLELMQEVSRACQDKKRVLQEQLNLIDQEKTKVESECDGLQYQVETRNIAQRITALADKLECVSQLGEPRENAFLTVEFAHNDSRAMLAQVLGRLGRVRTTTTFPSLCTAEIEGSCVSMLEVTAAVRTVDYHGDPRTSGGDPVTAAVETGRPDVRVECHVEDGQDGCYRVRFRPPTPGSYSLAVSVLERNIKDSPLHLVVSEHNNPLVVFGTRGSGKEELLQPVSVAIDDASIYVLDTGNSRIKVLSRQLRLLGHVDNAALTGRSCTGIATSSRGLVTVNWRTKTVTEMTVEGETIHEFTHSAFQEPIDVAVDANYGHILVADNGSSCIFVFDADGKFLFQVGKKGTHKGALALISSVTVGPVGEIVVADSRIQVFSSKGDFLEELYPEGKGRGRYGGVAVDEEGHLVATRSEKGRNVVQVFDFSSGRLLSTIDSHDAKLKRPSGLATTGDREVIVVDLGNDCVKKYRYW